MAKDAYSKEAALGRMMTKDGNWGPHVQRRAGRAITRLVARCRQLERVRDKYEEIIERERKAPKRPASSP